MQTPSCHLAKQIKALAQQAGELPMWGSLPSFPWERLSEALRTLFSKEGLEVFAGESDWKKEEALLEGMGENFLHMTFEMLPLEGAFSLLFPHRAFSKLSAWTIHPESKNEAFTDSYLQKGFFHFLVLEMVSLVEELHLFQGLSINPVKAPFNREEGYVINIGVKHENETIWGRLICSPLFHQSMKKHYASDWDFSFPSPLYESLLLPLSFTAGQTLLSQEEWVKMKEGDFLILDRASYHPQLKKGTFQLELNHTPLFQVKVKEESVKILDYAHYFEDHAMENEHFESPFEEEMEEGFGAEEEENEEEARAMVSPKEVPISLTIEVAKMTINLESFLKLKPGNVLDLTIQPEQGVDLIANGRCVGKGELLQIGDVIGVKVTKLGKGSQPRAANNTQVK